MRIIDTPLARISDESLCDLIAELSEVTNVECRSESLLWSFLTQCVYPWGAGKRYKLERNDLNPTRNLIKKVGRFRDTDVWNVCNEMAAMQSGSAELYENTALYIFLNKHLPDFEKKKQGYKFHPRDVRRLLGDGNIDQ
ncbi:MAG: hypothetical protein WC205_07395 [Opitutaceae bacterium]|jgi:hypothetical protein